MTIQPRRIVVGMTGASGQIYGVRLLQVLHEIGGFETHLVMSRAAVLSLAQETTWRQQEVEALADVVHLPGDIGASIASGSFGAEAMLVAPCSMKSLSAIAYGFGGDLISRAADVQLKEGRPVLLMVRETPLHVGHLENMVRAARMGCVIFPPVPAFYPHPQSLEDVIRETVGRMLARLRIHTGLHHEWEGLSSAELGQQIED
jgi:4-hydroxy-3-polyprenylbenzoate decarboxylase